MNVFVNMSSEFNPFVYSTFKKEDCLFYVFIQKCHYNLIKILYGNEASEIFESDSLKRAGFTGEQLERAGYKIHSVHNELFIWKLVKE